MVSIKRCVSKYYPVSKGGGRGSSITASVTRLGDFLHFGQFFKAFGNI